MMLELRQPTRRHLLGVIVATITATSLGAAQGVPGGVLSMPLADGATSVRFNGKTQLVTDGRAIIALPLSVQPGEHTVTVSTPAGEEHMLITVTAKDYPEQHLTIKNQRHVDPDPNDLVRIRKESALMGQAYRLSTAMPTQLAPFERPVDGPVSSLFGFRRVLNGQPRSPHSGLDIAAPSGTPIRNPAPGTVAVTGDFFFNGNTVLIDHGGGLISMMCHLSEIQVEDGQRVGRGEVLGAVGATGRATGPHLHWSVSLQGDRVDPQTAMAAINGVTDASSDAE